MPSNTTRKLLFTCLYFSEGAPIGFIWLAMPTRLRAREVPIEQITWLTAMLVLPWTLKFLWAPLIDLLRSRSWTLRHWIVTAQTMMGLTLLPLLWIDPLEQLGWIAATLLVHAVSAATQDVAIDAYCIATTTLGERGQFNGWMQTGMLAGRAIMGGGALILSTYVGDGFVTVMLIVLTTFSMSLVITLPQQVLVSTDGDRSFRLREIGQSIKTMLSRRNTWLGLLFGGVGGAAFKSLEVFYGPFLIDRGVSQDTIGWFSMIPMIGMMIVGSLLGGWLTDRGGVKKTVGGALVLLSTSVVALGLADQFSGLQAETYAFPILSIAALGIGIFTASSYALFMDLTEPKIAATQFSTFMGSTNGCESWSSYASGLIIAATGYSAAMYSMAAVSLVMVPVLFLLDTRKSEQVA
ncbi:MFS transporter [Rubripirellula reticaptiva]|uniref:Muropeptide transporter n=1 Tax=Rubripirellula reticaptiva TaxID=2528013 RepID=A0A5C6EET5_9BACT|nr:MFS transporter [Rubripirellula reticaptiva]TWU47005.1 muropeptide transporter [Rubripirellula reticaptiva]